MKIIKADWGFALTDNKGRYWFAYYHNDKEWYIWFCRPGHAEKAVTIRFK